jgi:genome maintenance exonuclease 1
MFNYCPPVKLPDLEAKTFEDGKRYYVTPEGEKLPSVTTVLGAMKKAEIMAWRKRVGEDAANAISRKAAGRGTNVHTLCERYLNNEKLGNIMPDAKEMFADLVPYLDKIDNIWYQEQALWSHQLGLAGRVDCIAEYEGELSVIDFKTSKRIKTKESIQDYFWQTCAYALMTEELTGIPVNDLVIIMAVDNEKPIIFKEKTEDHIEGLLKAIQFYNNQS